jgi:hypothetical protein
MATSGTNWGQLKVLARHGTAEQGQSSDGTGADGNLAAYNADGSLTDSGVAAGAAGTLTIGFVMNTGATGTNVGPELLAPHAGSVSTCKVRIKAADASTDLTFRINLNGSSVFTSDQTISAGTTGTVTITALTASPPPLAVSQDDVFSIDITSGTSSWLQFRYSSNRQRRFFAGFRMPIYQQWHCDQHHWRVSGR